MKVLKHTEMPLLKRTRYTIELEHLSQPTPKKDAIKKEIASLLKTQEELISIRHLYTKFGIGKTKAIVNVYQNIEDLKRLEKKKEVKAKQTKEQKPEAK